MVQHCLFLSLLLTHHRRDNEIAPLPATLRAEERQPALAREFTQSYANISLRKRHDFAAWWLPEIRVDDWPRKETETTPRVIFWQKQ
jgi:hypothetical protein